MKQRGVIVVYILAVLAMLAYGGYALYVPPPITLLELLQKELQHSNIALEDIAWKRLDYPEIYDKHTDLSQPEELQALYDMLNRYSVIPRKEREEFSLGFSDRLCISGTYRDAHPNNITYHHSLSIYLYPSERPGYVVVDIGGDRGCSPQAYALADNPNAG